MPLIFVTGTAGAGKSTVREELSRRGAQAYDTDEHGIAQWTHKVTGKITPLLADAHRTPQFLAENDWKAAPERMRHRLLTRTAHDFDTKPHELELLLAWNEAIDEHYLRRGAIVIDATKPPPLDVDEILHVLRTS